VGYGALMRQENDDGRRVQLLAIAEEQHLDLLLPQRASADARAGGREAVKAGSLVARIEEALSEDASDLERQREQISAQEKSRKEQVLQLQAQQAQNASEEKRMGRLASEGVAPAADLETLQHKREELAAGIRAREAEKGNFEAQERSLASRLDKVHRFEKEGTLISPVGGMVLTRYHREGEFVAAGDPIVTLQVEAPWLRVEVPEERLSAFVVGGSVTVWPQARLGRPLAARVAHDQAAGRVRHEKELGPPEPRPGRPSPCAWPRRTPASFLARPSSWKREEN
jgi:biotin carboxyl carrier protein